MGVARSLLLTASRSNWIAAQLRQRAFFRRAVKRFMPGEDLESALGAAAEFGKAGIGSVLTELGEQVTSRAEADAVRDHYLGVIGQIRQRQIPAVISVKLTHLGLDQDHAACFASLQALLTRAKDAGTFVWIDMEESRYVDATLDMYRRARAGADNVGVAMQAYLRRTPADLDALLPLKPTIRLVKGAYNEPARLAYPSKADVDAMYFQLAGRMLENVAHGARPIFGTHDLRLIARIQARAAALGATPKQYEFHMLYGIRATEQRELAMAGATVSVLISYGSAWFAWYMRRLAERPANVWFVLRNLF